MKKVSSKKIDGNVVEIYAQEYANSTGFELYINGKWKGTYPTEADAESNA